MGSPHLHHDEALPLPASAGLQLHLLACQVSRSTRSLQPGGPLSLSLPCQDCSGCSPAKHRIRLWARVWTRVWIWVRLPMGPWQLCTCTSILPAHISWRVFLHSQISDSCG